MSRVPIEGILKEILASDQDIELKLDQVLSWMSWDRNVLREAILKHETYSDKQRSAIILEMWGLKRDNKRMDR
jgi:hypothetical protein